MPKPAHHAHRRASAAALRLLIATLALVGASVAAEPNAAWLDRIAAGSKASGTEIDVAPWQAFLDRYLVTDHPSGIHRVRYDAVSVEDRAALDAWLAEQAGVDPARLDAATQMAWWINLYNAITVRVILDNPDVDSIREIRPSLFSIGPWGSEQITIAGEALSLDDIEHGILRPVFGDPRVHFAVNCASVGCPDLAAEAFTGSALERLLAGGARAYVNHPRGARFKGDRLHLSSIFKWYRDDFPAEREPFMAWLASHAEAPLAARLEAYEGRISHDYDWSLNAP